MKTKELLLLFYFCCPIVFANVYTGDQRVVANVGSHTILLSDFKQRYTDFLNSTGTKDSKPLREAVLNNMISEILLFSYDVNENIFSDMNYLKELEWTRKQAILAFLKDQDIYAKISVTEEELRKAFVRVNEQISARHLFVRTEDEANYLYELLQMGVDFENLAAQVFTDSLLRNNGGYLGYFTWGDMDPAFEEAAYSLKPGEISKPVKTAYGFSIIKVEERIPHPLLTEYEYQQKRQQMERTVKISKKKSSEQNFLNASFDRTKLIFYDGEVSELFDKLNSTKQSETDMDNLRTENCASYAGKKFSSDYFYSRLRGLPQSYLERIKSKENLKSAIEGILIQDILYNDAISKGYDTVLVVRNTIQAMHNNIYLRFKWNDIASNIELPDSVVQKFYNENIKIFSTSNEINVQEIIVVNDSIAHSIIGLLSAGKEFGELARQYSIREWSSKNNGVMGFASLSNFGMFKESLWAAEIGEILGPFKFESYIGIFKVIGKIDQKPIEFSRIKKEVEKAAKLDRKSMLVQEYIDNLRLKINIKIDRELLLSNDIVAVN